MPEDLGEKTEAPTPRRRQEAREQGQVARSQDLTAAVTLFGCILLLYVFGRRILGSMKVLVESMVGGAGPLDVTGTGDIGQLWATGMHIAAHILAPIALGALVLSLLASVGQVGFLISFRPLTPNLNKLSPLRGMRQLFSLRSGMRAVMAMGKVAIVAAVAGWTIRSQLPRVLSLLELGSAAALAGASSLVFTLALRIAIVLLVLAIADYAYQKWQHEQDMKMTKQEVKEEYKRMEGDPLVKQRRAKVARQVALQRVAMAVPRADVVVTNPTHFAVALRYDGEAMAAPKVTAKGADFLAMRIRQIAIGHQVPIVERPELARALYRHVEVGQEIPPQFYATVAEILAYVYRLSGRKTA